MPRLLYRNAGMKVIHDDKSVIWSAYDLECNSKIKSLVNEGKRHKL
jgi:hypothetical protein